MRACVRVCVHALGVGSWIVWKLQSRRWRDRMAVHEKRHTAAGAFLFSLPP